MDLGLKDQAFVIGGGSKGLGRAIAGILVEEGARVLLLSRSQPELDQTAGEIGATATLAVDMADPGTAQAVATAVDQHLGGKLDGVLVNAGGPPPGQVLDLDDDQWLGAYQLLIGGPIRLLRGLTPKMPDGGAVLFITSTSVRQPVAGLDTSNVLRPGVAAMAKVLARELAPAIRVNTIAPGRFDTDRVRSLDAGRAKSQGVPVEQVKAESSRQIPIGRYGEPVEFGRVGAFLLSPAASYVSGITVQVDGAMTTAVP